MKKIISLLTIVLVSVIAYSSTALAVDSFPKGRVTAIGDEPNGDGQELINTNQSGVTVVGAGSAQTKTCINCQTSPVLLTSPGRIAGSGPKSGTGGGMGTGVDDPVETGN